MYRWVLARERNERAWHNARALRKHAHAVACAYAREMGLTGEDRQKSLKAWSEIYFDDEVDLEGTWEWTTADGPIKTVF